MSTPFTDDELARLKRSHEATIDEGCKTCRFLATIAERDREIERLRSGDLSAERSDARWAVIRTDNNSWQVESELFAEAEQGFVELVERDVPCVLVEVHRINEFRDVPNIFDGETP